MKTILRHECANVIVEELAPGKNIINVKLLNNDLYIPDDTCETSYPIDLINKILDVKGPAWLCDEILRDESPDLVQRCLKYDLLSYVEEAEFNNKRLLDFGCGSGASTMVLARMFPYTEIVGVELEKKFLSIAKSRSDHYGYKNVQLIISPGPNELPPDLGYFDYVVLSAVYEHLLPDERTILLRKIWDVIKPGGILFINQTPNKYFPIEIHSTSGLPLINYLPDNVSLFYARHFSRRNLKECSWEDLLRQGIRGGSVEEILNIIDSSPQKPILLHPYRLGMEDRIDLFYKDSYIRLDATRFIIIKKIFLLSMKFLKSLTGIFILPFLSLAIKKESSLSLR